MRPDRTCVGWARLSLRSPFYESTLLLNEGMPIHPKEEQVNRTIGIRAEIGATIC
jgi:hypothetical protein